MEGEVDDDSATEEEDAVYEQDIDIFEEEEPVVAPAMLELSGQVEILDMAPNGFVTVRRGQVGSSKIVDVQEVRREEIVYEEVRAIFIFFFLF